MKAPLLRLSLILACTLGAFFAGSWWQQRQSAVPAVTTAPVVPSVVAAGSEASVNAAPSEAMVKRIFKDANPAQDLSRLLQLFRGGSKLAAQGQIALEVAKLNRAQIASWLHEIDLLPRGDSVQETMRNALVERWAEVDFSGLMAEAIKPQAGYNGRDQMNHWRIVDTAFRLLAVKNPQEAWEKSSHLGQMGYQAKNAIMGELALSNPEAGLKLISESKGVFDGWAARNFFQAWAGQNPVEAAAGLAGIKNMQVRSNALGSIASAWAQRDPNAALAWADGQANLSERSTACASVLNAQAESDPQGALANLQSRNLGGSQRYAMTGILRTWAMNDFDGALSYATSQSKYADKAASLSGIVGAINGDEGRARQLQTLAPTLPAPLAREIYSNGLYAFMYTAPDKIQGWIDEIKSPSIKESVLKNALQNQRYYGMDQEIFSKLFTQQQPTSQSPDDASNIASGWAYQDPDKAVAWADKIENVESRKKALAAAVGTWAYKDPQATADYVTAMAPGDARDEAFTTLVNSWMGADPKGAQAWANGFTGTDRSKVLGALVQQAQEQDPDTAPQAYEKFATSLSPEDATKKENQAIARSVAANMAQDDPQKAITWLATLPTGGAREQAIGGIAESWINFDPASASEWITNLSPGEGRDTAAGKLATTIARDDPDAAFVWATSIADPAARRKSTESVLGTWKNNGGKDAAITALGSANFTEQERAELLKKLE